MSGINISTLTTLIFDITENPIIKYDIYEVTLTFTPRGNTITIVSQYFEHHKMFYVSHLKKNIPWNRNISERDRTNVWILIIGRKETTVPKDMEDI